MSADTSIEWTGKTWNPVRGCSRVSEGCRNCYAETFAARNLPGMRSPTTGEPFAEMVNGDARWRKRPDGTPMVELIPEALDAPLRWRKPRRIFVNSMSDLFHEALPDDAIDCVFAVMALAPRHTFQILTKRPDRMRAYSAAMAALNPKERTRRLVASMYRGHPAERLVSGEVSDDHVGDLAWPLPNVWLGVSVEDQATADERIPLLLQTPAAVRFVSYEPALGPVDFGAFYPFSFKPIHPEVRRKLLGMYPGGLPANSLNAQYAAMKVAWVIVGGESGPGARPFDVEWARSTVRQCKAAGVPVFVKQLGAQPFTRRGLVLNPGESADDVVPQHSHLTGRAPLNDRKGGDPEEWPADMRVREFPA